MTRARLPIVADRALEIVPRAKLRQLVGDMVRIEGLTEGKPGAASLLDEVRRFHEASLRREYYGLRGGLALFRRIVLRGGLGDPGGGSRGDRGGGGQSDRPGGGQSDRRNWPDHAVLGDQGRPN